MAKNIRDLFSGTPIQNPTLQSLASDVVTERTLVREEGDEIRDAMTARMPGDDISDHPLIQSQLNNPFYGMSPLTVSRMLREGAIEPRQEKQARAWVKQYESLTGETVFSSPNHDFQEPEITSYGGQLGVRPADPWPYNKG